MNVIKKLFLKYLCSKATKMNPDSAYPLHWVFMLEWNEIVILEAIKMKSSYYISSVAPNVYVRRQLETQKTCSCVHCLPIPKETKKQKEENQMQCWAP